MMSKKRIFFIKVISIIALLSISLPSQKFNMPYSLAIFLTLSERIIESDLSYDLLMSLVAVIGMVLVFNKSRIITAFGYLLSIILLCISIIYLSNRKFDLYFWIPLAIFISCVVIVFVNPFKNKKELVTT